MRRIPVIFLALSLFAAQSFRLKDVILQSLVRNPDIVVRKYQPVISKYQLEASKAKFIPVLRLSGTDSENRSKSTSIFEGRKITVFTETSNFSLSLEQSLPTGGTLSVSANQSRFETSNEFYSLNPRYTTFFSLEFRQPILKGFGPDVARADIIIQQKNFQQSLENLRAEVAQIVLQVINSYWNYIYTLEYYKVQKESLKLAKDFYEQVRNMVKVGAKAPIDLVEAEAEVARREADLIDAQKAIQDAKEQLMHQTGLQYLAEKLELYDRPSTAKVEFDLDQLIDMAIKQRPEIRAAMKELEKAAFNIKIKKNALRPQLDLALSLSTTGVAGDKIKYLNNNPFTGIIIGKEEGSPYDAIEEALRAAYNRWQVSLNLSIPVKRKKEEAELEAAISDYYRAKRNLEKLRKEIELEVRQAYREVISSYKKIEATRKARKLAEEKLRAEQTKYSQGLSTNYMVLTYQRDLTNAKIQELKALIDYNIALYKLKKAVGSLLADFNVIIKMDENISYDNLIQRAGADRAGAEKP